MYYECRVAVICTQCICYLSMRCGLLMNFISELFDVEPEDIRKMVGCQDLVLLVD